MQRQIAHLLPCSISRTLGPAVADECRRRKVTLSGDFQDCLAARESCGGRKLHLRCCQEKCADALWIIRPNLLVDVILVAAIAIGIAAESSAPKRALMRT